MDLAHFRGFPLGKPFSLVGLLPVMPHQVVSLTALDRQHSASSQEERLSLFAFDVDEGITRDIQHLDILYIVLDGIRFDPGRSYRVYAPKRRMHPHSRADAPCHRSKKRTAHLAALRLLITEFER